MHSKEKPTSGAAGENIYFIQLAAPVGPENIQGYGEHSWKCLNMILRLVELTHFFFFLNLFLLRHLKIEAVTTAFSKFSGSV